ncbi:MAG: hypothetical protein U0835_22930 [Isosphaeraceae bacterium]
MAVVDLFGSYLCLDFPVASENLIDVEAAGHGWFVEATPPNDSEFEDRSSGLRGRMDLLSVGADELGHLIGLGHDDDSHNVMGDALLAGTRRMPLTRADVVDAVISQWQTAAGSSDGPERRGLLVVNSPAVSAGLAPGDPHVLDPSTARREWLIGRPPRQVRTAPRGFGLTADTVLIRTAATSVDLAARCRSSPGAWQCVGRGRVFGRKVLLIESAFVQCSIQRESETAKGTLHRIRWSGRKMRRADSVEAFRNVASFDRGSAGGTWTVHSRRNGRSGAHVRCRPPPSRPAESDRELSRHGGGLDLRSASLLQGQKE